MLPAASDYLAKGDTARARDLLVRGTRYVLALVVPGVVVVMVLAGTDPRGLARTRASPRRTRP